MNNSTVLFYTIGNLTPPPPRQNQKVCQNQNVQGKISCIKDSVYIDDGFTGTNFTRPSFQNMTKDIESGHINCVIVKDLSRFGRDYIDTGKYLERYFPVHNVRFISITDNIDSLQKPYDLLLPIKNIFNEQYARDISEKIHASVSTKQKAGEFIGAFASYGYKKSPSDKNKLIIDEYAAEVIRRIFRLYLSGCGKMRIASILNEDGIVCPSEYKKMNGENYRNSNRLQTTCYWTYSTINRILQNELYTGNMVQGRKTQHMRQKPKSREKSDWIIVENTHEPIIDKADWEKAQELLKRRTRTLSLHTNVSIFAGFLKCKDCGRAMTKKAPQHYYCGTYVRSGRQYCTPHSISHAVLEKIILEDIQVILSHTKNLRQLLDQNYTAALAHQKPSHTPKASQLHAKLKKIQKLKQSIYEDYKEDLISKKEYITYREDYIKKEDLLLSQIKRLTEPLSGRLPDTCPEILPETPGKSWCRHLLEHQNIQRLDRSIIVEMIHKIEIYDGHKIKIIYNFSNEGEYSFPPQSPAPTSGIKA